MKIGLDYAPSSQSQDAGEKTEGQDRKTENVIYPGFSHQNSALDSDRIEGGVRKEEDEELRAR